MPDEPQSQWQMMIKFVADLAGVKQASQGQDEIIRKTNEATAAVQRYDQAVQKMQQRSSIGLASSAPNLDTLSRQYKFIGKEHDEHLVKVRQSANADAEAMKAQERDWAKKRDMEGFLNEGFQRRAALRAKEAADLEKYNQLSIAAQQRAYNAAKAAQQKEKLSISPSQYTTDSADPIAQAEKAAAEVEAVGLKTSGMFMVIGVGLGVVYSALASFRQSIKELADIDTPQLKSLPDMMENVREKTYQAELAIRDYWKEFDRRQNLPEDEASKAQYRLQYIRETARFDQQIAESGHRRDIDMLEAEERAGVISHEQAARRKYQLDERYYSMKLALAKKEMDDELQIKRDQLAGDEKKLQSKGPQLADAQRADQAAGGSVEKEQEKLGQLKSDRDAIRAKIADLQKQEIAIKDEMDMNPLMDPLTGAAKTEKIFQIRDQIKKLGGQDGELSQSDQAVAKQIEVLHRAEGAQRDAAQSMADLKSEVDALNSSVHGLRIAIGHDEVSTDRRKQQASTAADVDKAGRDAGHIQQASAAEIAAGIPVGSAGSSFRLNPSQARAWSRMNAAQRKANPGAAPQVEYDPTKTGASGLPVDPNQARNLNTWEPGAQQQYNERRYAGYQGGADNHDAQLIRQIGEIRAKRDATSQAIAEYHDANKEALEALRAQLQAYRDDIARMSKDHNSRINDSFNK